MGIAYLHCRLLLQRTRALVCEGRSTRQEMPSLLHIHPSTNFFISSFSTRVRRCRRMRRDVQNDDDNDNDVIQSREKCDQIGCRCFLACPFLDPPLKAGRRVLASIISPLSLYALYSNNFFSVSLTPISLYICDFDIILFVC